MTTTETTLFNLSSGSANDKLNGSMNSHMNFYINNFLHRTDTTKNIFFSIYSAEVPNSFYLINQYNNILYIQDYTGTINTYTLGYGNYTINSLLTKLQLLLGSSYTLTFNSITLTMTFTNSKTFTVLGTSTMTRILGLNVIDTIATLTSGIYSFTTPYVINLLPYQKIHFRSNSLGLSNFNTFDNSTDVFLSLQNSSPSGSGIYYKNYSRTRFLLEVENIQLIDIRVTDDKNRNLDFNNCEWFLTIQIDIEYIERPPKITLDSFLKHGKEKHTEEIMQYFTDTWRKSDS